jgi:hypothetical protein
VKAENSQANPRVAIGAVDPDNAHRTLQLQGRIVERRHEDADEHINKLSQKYNGRPYPLRAEEQRVVLRIQPVTAIERGLESGTEKGGYAIHERTAR